MNRMTPCDVRHPRRTTRRFVAAFLWMLLVMFPIGAEAQTYGSLDLAPEASGPVLFDGFLEPAEDILVSGTELGRIEKIFVEMGDRVQAGEPIAQLDDSRQRIAVDIAKMEAEKRGEWQSAKSEWKMYDHRHRQLVELHSRDMARPDEVTRAKRNLDMSAAQLQAASEEVRLRQLAVDRARLDLQRRKILAPKSGWIDRVLHSEGEYVTPTDSAIVRLIVTDTLEATFNVPPRNLRDLRIGDVATIFVTSAQQSVRGELLRMSPSMNRETGTVEVRFRVDNAERTLRSGDQCRLHLSAGSVTTTSPSTSDAASADRPIPELPPAAVVVRGRPRIVAVSGNGGGRP